jgi:uncharacterized protein YjbI with pentapeptide repeats
MANPEHLKILEQGVESWNKWRIENPDIKPDLSGAHLRGMKLSCVDFKQANLSESKMHSAMLQGAKFSGARLVRAEFSYANLIRANFVRAFAERAYFPQSALLGATLIGANLRETGFSYANLSGAKLCRADCSDANFQYSYLVCADLSGATITGIKLFGSARDKWIIKNIKCSYAYLSEFNNLNRFPKDRDFGVGEFERLYVSLPTIEFIFENGMAPIDPLIMDRVVQVIREKQPQFDIKIDSIDARGLAPAIKFTVRHEENKEPALEAVRKEYEIKLKQLESERDRYYQLLARALDSPKEVKLINAAPGSIVATDGSTVSVEQHIHNALELQKVVSDEPEESESFAKVAKKTALDIIGGAIKDIAKGQIKEAAKQIIELGEDLEPLFVRIAPLAYEFFKSIIT